MKHGDYYGFALLGAWFYSRVYMVSYRNYFTSQGDAFWESSEKNWKLHLALGMTSYFYRWFNNFLEDYALDNRLIAFESFNFIF